MDVDNRDFFIAEFNTAWDMIFAINTRFGMYSRYNNLLFLSVLAVSTNILINIEKMNVVSAAGLTSVLAASFASCMATVGILRSERAADVRYRKKINLIREMFLGKSEDEKTKHYLTHKNIGIKLLSEEGEQPKGFGRTLNRILGLIRIQKGILLLFAVVVWSYLIKPEWYL